MSAAILASKHNNIQPALTAPTVPHQLRPEFSYHRSYLSLLCVSTSLQPVTIATLPDSVRRAFSRRCRNVRSDPAEDLGPYYNCSSTEGCSALYPGNFKRATFSMVIDCNDHYERTCKDFSIRTGDRRLREHCNGSVTGKVQFETALRHFKVVLHATSLEISGQ